MALTAHDQPCLAAISIVWRVFGNFCFTWKFTTLSKSMCRKSGISKPRFCQTYVLQSGAFRETMGITETTKTAQTAMNKGVNCRIRRNHGNHGNNEKPRESGVQNIGSPKPRFRKTRAKGRERSLFVQFRSPFNNHVETFLDVLVTFCLSPFASPPLHQCDENSPVSRLQPCFLS